MGLWVTLDRPEANVSITPSIVRDNLVAPNPLALKKEAHIMTYSVTVFRFFR